MRKRKGMGCSSLFLTVMLLIIFTISAFSIVFPNGTLRDSLKSSDAVSQTTDVSGTSDTTDNTGTTQGIDNNNSGEDFQNLYKQLNKTEKRIYRAALSAIKDEKLEFTIKDVDYDTYLKASDRAINALLMDHPEFFWLHNGCSYEGVNATATSKGRFTMKLGHWNYWKSGNDQKKYLDRLQKEVDKVAKLTEGASNDYEKVKIVHDYIVNNNEYDKENLEESKKDKHRAEADYIYSAYGCLVNKKSVCAGYAKAFKLILNNIGINASDVWGWSIEKDGKKGEAHEWNWVELDGEYYYFDVTWDDMDFHNNEKYKDVSLSLDGWYAYFGISDEEMTKDHMNDNSQFSFPKSGSDKYNYFTYSEFCLDEYDEVKIEEVLSKQSESNPVCIKFSSKSDYEKALLEMSTGNWNTLFGRSASVHLYRQKDEGNVILICFK